MPNNETYSLSTQSPPHQKVIEEILKAGGSIKQSELGELTGQFLGLLKATILVLNSKGIIKSEALTDGDKQLIIDPKTSTLDQKTLIDYKLLDASDTLTDTENKIEIQEPITQPSSNEKLSTLGTVNIAPRPKKIDTISAKSLLPMLKATVNGDFFTSTVAEQLNLKPEVIQDALIELSNDGYFIVEEQDLGEGFFEPTLKFNDFTTVIKKQPSKDIDGCINDILHYLTKNEGSASLGKINKDISEHHPVDVIEEALNVLSTKKTVVRKKIGRGLTIEYPRILKNIVNKINTEYSEENNNLKPVLAASNKTEEDDIKEEVGATTTMSFTQPIEQPEVNPTTNTEIQALIDLSKQQTSDLTTLIAKYMIQNIELEKRLQTANALLKQHGINVDL
ncbi:hypothetical protein C0W52_18915 [Photobacterium kishitanii]|uniref:MarR family transcriptional regulator n=2 Tax=Photobacterium kishitanii TaxID=318456 RepID=A0AAX0YNF4_9GAMM|nr:hypothetical protein [Photobacterium kishitanii]PSX15924.1 hypothetical protein C0W70_22685 [Photobacterium kishitanii]PSX26281.1 hypothetical protein C0W52_18915 [Photobacterium kishitanii]PSX26923.1 hypothetical protein C0W39_22315 [Photobacterium kishitanii]PSX38692.1 hypothetical protein C0W53_22950 [Photobacterium kishitanii]